LFSDAAFTLLVSAHQARNQSGAGSAKPPLEQFSLHLEECVGHRLKLLDIIQEIWAPLRKLFAPPGVPNWLRAWCTSTSCMLPLWFVPSTFQWT